MYRSINTKGRFLIIILVVLNLEAHKIATDKKAPTVYHFPPRLIIFDLDSLVWPFWINCPELVKPLEKLPDGQIMDAVGVRVKPYDDVEELLEFLNNNGYKLALVGRIGHEVIDIYDWKKYFKYIELHPGPKTEHIATLHNMTGYAYKDFLYFGYKSKEVGKIKKLNVTAIVSNKEFKKKILYRGVKKYAKISGAMDNKIQIKLDHLDLEEYFSLQTLGSSVIVVSDGDDNLNVDFSGSSLTDGE